MSARRLLPIVVLLALSACARNARKDVDDSAFLAEGLASYYGKGFHGRITANGERFDRDGRTAAHRTLRFGTCLVVLNVSNDRAVRVRVNDRGPYAGKRIIDLSEGAARELEMLDRGVTKVRLYRCPDD